MDTMTRVPAFFYFRIYLFALLMYFLLVLPVGSILSLKNGPDWMRTQGRGIVGDTTEMADTTVRFGLLNFSTTSDSTERGNVRMSREAPKAERSLFTRSMRTINQTLLVSIVVGLVFNLPFKRYFRLRRKGRRISPRLREFCKRNLLRVPWANALLLASAFVVIHVVMLINLNQLKGSPVAELEKRLFIQFFYISLVAAVLVVLFLFFWEKHRVHLRYLEHIFSAEELRTRIMGKLYFRIRSRMWVTSGMTTLLPLAIVIFYLFLSLTTLSELKIDDISDQQAHILFGKYLSFFENLPRTEFSKDFFYVNAVDSILMFIGIFTGIFISLVYILFFVRWNTEDIVSPVKQLLASMERTGEGELEQYSLVRTNDEVGQLTEGYNQMTARLKASFDNIKGLTDAYSRFVPRQFLDILGKENYTDIRLGDQVEREMTVLFSDIRSFTTLSETMTPKQNFDFINAYLGVMEPVIGKNNGFIDKYIGDAIMALFPGPPDDAVHAAIAMRVALESFNRDMSLRGLPVIECGIGIHTGRLMLGIVGAEGRMDGTVISDAVNLAARLEGLTKEYGSVTIISEASINKMNNAAVCHFRYLDRTLVKGKQERVTIFELIDAEPEAKRNSKLLALPVYEDALRCIAAGKHEEAEALLRSFLEHVPLDIPSLRLLTSISKDRQD